MTEVLRPTTVRAEHDVVVLRQSIREAGRTIGLTLVQQAKMTTAISTVSRRLLHEYSQLICRVYTEERRNRHTFAVECRFTELIIAGSTQKDTHAFEFNDVQALVDEATVVRTSGEALLTLRMRISD